MKQSTKSHFTLFEACARWEKTLPEVIGWAANGDLRVETGIPFANTDDGPIAGAVELNAADILRMARLDRQAPRQMRVHRVREQGKDNWTFVKDENDAPGIEIEIDDIYIPADEYRRFEQKHDLGPPARTVTAKKPTHNWEGMYMAICKRVFEKGLPETKEALCREMEEFFETVTDGDTAAPDISTIRRKISPLWTALREAD